MKELRFKIRKSHGNLILYYAYAFQVYGLTRLLLKKHALNEPKMLKSKFSFNYYSSTV